MPVFFPEKKETKNNSNTYLFASTVEKKVRVAHRFPRNNRHHVDQQVKVETEPWYFFLYPCFMTHDYDNDDDDDCDGSWLFVYLLITVPKYLRNERVEGSPF